MTKNKEIFLIEKGWIDPIENRIALGYNIIGFLPTEEEAKKYCANKGYWTRADCWAIHDAIFPNGRMPKFKYIRTHILNDK